MVVTEREYDAGPQPLVHPLYHLLLLLVVVDNVTIVNVDGAVIFLVSQPPKTTAMIDLRPPQENSDAVPCRVEIARVVGGHAHQRGFVIHVNMSSKAPPIDALHLRDSEKQLEVLFVFAPRGTGDERGTEKRPLEEGLLVINDVEPGALINLKGVVRKMGQSSRGKSEAGVNLPQTMGAAGQGNQETERRPADDAADNGIRADHLQCAKSQRADSAIVAIFGMIEEAGMECKALVLVLLAEVDVVLPVALG